MFSLFKSSLFPIQTGFRISFSVGDSGHCQIHADFAAFTVEIGYQLIEDIFLVGFRNIRIVFDGCIVYTEFVFGSEFHLTFDFLKVFCPCVTYRALCRWDISLVNVATDFTNEFCHFVSPLLLSSLSLISFLFSTVVL